MNVIVRYRGEEYEVQLRLAGDGGTVGDLVESWFDDVSPVVAIDGNRLALSVPLAEAGLGEGSLLEVAAAEDPRQHALLVCRRGPLAGRGYQVTTGTMTIGASPANIALPGVAGQVRLHSDAAGRVSLRNPEHLMVHVDGSLWSPPAMEIQAGSVVDVEGHSFRLDAVGSDFPKYRGVFNRPPRLSQRRGATVLEPPMGPPQPAKAMRFGWGALVVPVVLGLAMAVLIHPRMAMFAIFSPAMLLANWFEDRRRVRKERSETGDAYRERLRTFRAVVDHAYESDVAAVRAAALSPQELHRRAAAGDPRLWERRADHEDFMEIPVGVGCVPWNVDIRGAADAEAADILRRHSVLHDVPISISLTAGAVTGIAGERNRVLGLCRNVILQAAVSHGPADLEISVFTESPADWDWAKWLPHVLVDSSGRRRLAGSEEEIGDTVQRLPTLPTGGQGRCLHLVVVDLPSMAVRPAAAIREALRVGETTAVAGLALAPRPLDLPSLASTIVAVTGDTARIRFRDGAGAELAPWRIGAADARFTSRALARITDPEARAAGPGLPELVQLTSLLGLEDDLEDSIREKWSRPSMAMTAPIGVGDDGILSVDLVTDGPHALLSGTTGAGKSELLRTLVASLAVATSPSRLNFVLVDYKGGSAFDACGALPHTVGLVTDLDEHLARRALTCLEAELRYREHRLRVAGVSDVEMFPVTPSDPLPRLLVVVDEFAALAKELPEFMEALVGIAQRGRSLGVHLLLATQRPAGVISDSIKANTNLRIALRVQDNADSVDVIGCTDAAAIGRNQPGRGLVRLGPRQVVPFQTAIVTSHSLSGRVAAVQVQPFVFAHEQPRPAVAVGDLDGQPTDLERIVAAAGRVAAGLHLPAPRLPWPDVLPTSISRDELDGSHQAAGGTVFALADEPQRQRQVTASWSPATGNLLIYGLPGSGTTTALATLATGLAAGNDPDRLHLYVLDFDDQLLRSLQKLPHVGAVVGADDRERQLRILRRLSGELHDRRGRVAADPAAVATGPTIVVMVDNYGGFADAFDEPGDMPIRNLFARLVADGPGVGMYTIATAKHPGDIPTRITALVASKLAFRLADRYDYCSLGMPAVEPPTRPGRAFESGTGREIQVAVPHPQGLATAVESNHWGAPLVAPWSIEVLPHDVSVADVIDAAWISDEQWFLPLGIGDVDLAPTGLVLREGEHALITGPARAGKSTALATLAMVAKAANPGLRIAVVAPRRSPITGCPAVDRIVEVGELEDLAGIAGPQLLLVDDAELVGESRYLSQLVVSRNAAIHVVAAGSADVIRTLYGHWTQEIRRSRIGCALRPNLAADGDLWHTPLPRRGPEPFPTGRGYLLADGRIELVQLGRS